MTSKGKQVQRPTGSGVPGSRRPCRFPEPRATSQTAVSNPRYGERMSDQRRIVDLEVRLGGERVSSETTAICAGPDVVIVVTVLPDHGVLFELTTTFVGHKGVDTHVAHLVLGPPGKDHAIETEDHPHERLNPTYDPRGCAYEHIHVLMVNRPGDVGGLIA